MSESTRENLREEFNRWAEVERGEGMERDHLPIVLPVLEKMRIAPGDNLLDVGCGSGWLSRRLAKVAPEGRVVGMDISDEMIRVARRTSAEHTNILYVNGEAAGIREIFRVLGPGGAVWILINYYRDNVHCHQWGPLLAVSTQLLAAAEWT